MLAMCGALGGAALVRDPKRPAEITGSNVTSVSSYANRASIWESQNITSPRPSTHRQDESVLHQVRGGRTSTTTHWIRSATVWWKAMLSRDAKAVRLPPRIEKFYTSQSESPEGSASALPGLTEARTESTAGRTPLSRHPLHIANADAATVSSHGSLRLESGPASVPHLPSVSRRDERPLGEPLYINPTNRERRELRIRRCRQLIEQNSSPEAPVIVKLPTHDAVHCTMGVTVREYVEGVLRYRKQHKRKWRESPSSMGSVSMPVPTETTESTSREWVPLYQPDPFTYEELMQHPKLLTRERRQQRWKVVSHARVNSEELYGPSVPYSTSNVTPAVGNVVELRKTMSPVSLSGEKMGLSPSDIPSIPSVDGDEQNLCRARRAVCRVSGSF